MTTRRERLERRAELRTEWAAKAKARSGEAFARAHSIVSSIPLGQPILVGHHSEKRHRADIDRMGRAMDRGCELESKAAHHHGKAANIEAALARTIFTDDENAKEALAKREGRRAGAADRMVAINAAWRKAGKPRLLDGREGWATMIELAKMTPAECDSVTNALRYRYEANPQPFPAYAITNCRASARRDAKRAQEVDDRAKADAAAQAAPGGVLITGTEDWCNVRFAEKPAREVIETLKAAGFHWGAGKWMGYRSKLPACVLAMQGGA